MKSTNTTKKTAATDPAATAKADLDILTRQRARANRVLLKRRRRKSGQ